MEISNEQETCLLDCSNVKSLDELILLFKARFTAFQHMLRYQCIVCQNYHSFIDFMKHVAKHSMDEFIKCTICNFSTSQIHAICCHMQEMHLSDWQKYSGKLRTFIYDIQDCLTGDGAADISIPNLYVSFPCEKDSKENGMHIPNGVGSSPNSEENSRNSDENISNPNKVQADSDKLNKDGESNNSHNTKNENGISDSEENGDHNKNGKIENKCTIEKILSSNLRLPEETYKDVQNKTFPGLYYLKYCNSITVDIADFLKYCNEDVVFTFPFTFQNAIRGLITRAAHAEELAYIPQPTTICNDSVEDEMSPHEMLMRLQESSALSVTKIPAPSKKKKKKSTSKTIEPLKKKLCLEEMKSIFEASNDPMDILPIEGGEFICDFCEQPYATQEFLDRHIILHIKPYACEFCEFRSNTEENLESHALTHFGTEDGNSNDNSDTFCEDCNKNFSNNACLRRHLRTHTGEKPYVCLLCDKSFARKDHYLTHAKTHNKTKSVTCSICNFECGTKKSLKLHINVAHGDKPFHCEYCKYKGAKQGDLVKHMSIHKGEGNHTCHVCNAPFATISNLNKHLKSHKKLFRNKLLECEYCEYKTYINSQLIEHSKIHNLMMFYCTECDFESDNKLDLTDHMRIHSELQSFTCDYCDYKCGIKEELDCHILTHTKEELFTCKYCSYRSNTSSNLAQHLELIHEKPLTKLIECEFCEFKCEKEEDIQDHIAIHL